MGATTKAVDFSQVKERGAFNPKRVQLGDYAATVTKVEDKPVKDTGEFQYEFTIKLDKFSQNSYPYRCKIVENQLWKLRNLAVAAGINVPKKRMKFDPNKIVGKKIGVTMEDDEYNGKPKSEIASVFPLSELADGPLADDDTPFDDEDEAEANAPVKASDDEDEAPSEKKSKKGKKGKKGKKSSDENVEDLDISDIA